MEIIKEGWLETRSKYFRRWEWKWATLNSAYLSFFRDYTPSSKLLMQIPINEIVTVCPADKKDGKYFTLVVLTQKTKLTLSFGNLNEVISWQNSIKSFINLQNIPLNNQNLEQKIMTDMKLISAANKLKHALIDREEELQEILDTENAERFEELQNNVKEIITIIEKEQELYMAFKEAVNSETNPLLRLKKAFELKRPSLKLQEIDASLKSRVEVAIPDKIVSKLIENNIETSLLFKNEHKISRSRMPWGTKWKYNGKRVDAISLRVSKPILLRAVGICSPYKEKGCNCVKSFCIYDGPGTNCPLIYTHPQSVYMEYTGNSTFKIPLKSPVILQANTIYTLFFQIQGSPTFRCKNCILSEQGEGDVAIEFFNSQITAYKSNKTDTVTGTIADLYYQLI
ncbi:unnamed protein product [Blepharisma stoltei]|uniref:PH domain-containing protein n=1 Tax=Blepharisma stoltei TaxID=1481888 RepID=A0AAU9I7W7_9CILI|nr:unnamed protein product [Blepharisma stoltei]